MTIVRFAGGPVDGQVLEIDGEPMEFLYLYHACDMTDRGEGPRRIATLAYRRTTAFARDRARYYVAPDFNRSLIDDETIAVAAGWLAKTEVDLRFPPEITADRPDISALALCHSWSETRSAAFNKMMRRFVMHKLELTRIRDSVTIPDAKIGLDTAFQPVTIKVVVYPSIVAGYVGDGADPAFVSSPKDSILAADGMGRRDLADILAGRPIAGQQPLKLRPRTHPLPLPD